MFRYFRNTDLLNICDKSYCDPHFTEGETEAQKDLITYLGMTQLGSGRACAQPLSCAISKCGHSFPRRKCVIGAGNPDPR